MEGLLWTRSMGTRFAVLDGRSWSSPTVGDALGQLEVPFHPLVGFSVHVVGHANFVPYLFNELLERILEHHKRGAFLFIVAGRQALSFSQQAICISEYIARFFLHLFGSCSQTQLLVMHSGLPEMFHEENSLVLH